MAYPSGHKSRKQWEEEFRNEHDGQDPADQDWWDCQFSLQIENWIAALWGQTYGLRSQLWNAEVTIEAGDVKWKLDEVTAIGQAIGNIALAFGNNARRIVGGAVIQRMRAHKWPLGFSWRSCPGYQALGKVYINDSAFIDRFGNRSMTNAQHIVTHELGHYFQESQGLIGDFRKATGGSQFNLFGMASLNMTPYKWGGTPPNKWVKDNGLYEDFAASFETYVYYMMNNQIQGNTMGYKRALFFDGFVE